MQCNQGNQKVEQNGSGGPGSAENEQKGEGWQGQGDNKSFLVLAVMHAPLLGCVTEPEQAAPPEQQTLGEIIISRSLHHHLHQQHWVYVEEAWCGAGSSLLAYCFRNLFLAVSLTKQQRESTNKCERPETMVACFFPPIFNFLLLEDTENVTLSNTHSTCSCVFF